MFKKGFRSLVRVWGLVWELLSGNEQNRRKRSFFADTVVCNLPTYVSTGAARAVAALSPPGVEAHFVVAACDNMIGPQGLVPSDVLTASNGKTIEVLNTDAVSTVHKWADIHMLSNLILFRSCLA